MQVFVYGTLTDSEQVESLLGDGPGTYESLGPATLEGFHRVDGAYPTLLPGGTVDGELLAVDDRALERLDRYEGVDRGLYVRVTVPRADGGSAQLYVGDPDKLGVAVDGVWTDDRPFADAVRAYIVREDTVVLNHE
ncbi:gamma-glutamylcyclotransferase family protein [Natronorubrum texcoconense]|uniref:gamma-glutamylcyclotransferase family protein n=1 Tax=Natronorubrum texcoconense TaxID=1095776 RepID=UPI000AE8EFC8|nr:gamma-glutamylcyclotransferase family protein [Natronorubrum texcoconense]